MQGIGLNGTWQLTFGPEGPDGPKTPEDLARAGWRTVPATVPGNVELDLLAAGLIQEPSRGNHIYDLRPYETYEWWYRRAFTGPKLETGQRAELVFEGLDCFGAVWLNGALLGRTENMFVAHRFDVTDALRAGGNELAVRIGSAVLEGRKHQPAPEEFAFRMNWESLNVRKAPHMYGWDIMPRLVSAGLWRPVRLEVLDPTRWRSVYWTTLTADPARRTAQALVDWDFAAGRRDVDGLCVRVALTRDGRAAHRSEHPVVHTHGRARLELNDVDLWWPRGYGAAALYDATVELLDKEGRALDTHAGRVGLRTLALRRSEVTTDEEPGEFAFIVNGERIFVKGTNWVPLDALHSRDPRHLAVSCGMLADLNCNMVRCWGGNVYEDHAFFDFCDANGILVWQDFALACALYPQSEQFAARLRAEAEAVVAKLRNHASLALWAGNNEIDECFAWTGMDLDPNSDRLSRQVLPEVLRRLDPVRPYLPSSPYRSPELVRRGNRMELEPEQHLWGPRDDFKGPFYTQSRAHFVSEIGYHGCPDRRSLEEFLDPEFLWPWRDNDQWLTHAVRPHLAETAYDYRIALMGKQIAVLFERVPEELDDYVLASQISQAEALKFFIEFWRGGKWRRTGMLWWNLRDGWPIISDSIVDYYNRKKLAYEYVRRVQADICALCGEAEGGRHPLLVVNDTLRAAAGRLTVRDADSGRVLHEGAFAVERNGKAVAGHAVSARAPALWLLEWTVEGGGTFLNHYLAGPRPFSLSRYKEWLKKLKIPPGIGSVERAQ